jgi:hypothetical protein
LHPMRPHPSSLHTQLRSVTPHWNSPTPVRRRHPASPAALPCWKTDFARTNFTHVALSGSLNSHNQANLCEGS